MRHLLLALMAALSLAAAAAADTAEFNVATYNIRQLNRNDSLRGNGWERRCPVVAQLVAYHDFAVFGTQEGFRRQLDELKALLPGYDYIGVGREDGKEQGEHSAIFFDTARFELIDHGDFWLSQTPSLPSLGWDAACIRICTWGHFRHRASGREFRFFNLHLDHEGTLARTEGVKLALRRIAECSTPLPTLLSGDFNVDQRSDAYLTLTSGGLLTDSYHAAPLRYALCGTFNDYHTDELSDSRIDHIFLSGDIKVMRYGILTDSYRIREADGSVTSRLPSDHYPVAVRIRL